MNPFEEAQRVVTTQWLEEVQSPYMTTRILSSSPDTFVAAAMINQSVSRLPKQEVAALFNLVVPKSNRKPFFHYPKKGKAKGKKFLQKVCTTFGVNQYHARQIIEILRQHNPKPESLFGLKKDE
jgi:uncharacterized protein YajQ (UPF0234 family)